MKNLIIVGAGGCGREVYEWSKSCFDPAEYTVKGFLSTNPDDLDGFTINRPILGCENTYTIIDNDYFLLAIADIKIRRKVHEVLSEKSARFATLIHPSALISSTARIGEGAIICPFTMVNDHCKIGRFTIMNFYSSCGHDAVTGDFCVMSPYSTLNGAVVLEDDVFLATHSTVTLGKKVGKGCVIAGNSIVLHDVPAGTKVIGRTYKNTA